jgi:hypothetical protein
VSPSTVFLARLIGLFTVLVVICLLVRGTAIIDTTVSNAPVMLIYAVVSLALGIAMVLRHNIWSGGALPVIVTVVGWLILAKGLVLLLLKPEALAGLIEGIHLGENHTVYLAPALVIGLYLTWAGFHADVPDRR